MNEMIKHNENKRIIVGVLIMIVGAALLMRNFGIYSYYINHYIFRWEMILIAIGLVGILSHKGPHPGYILFIIGGAFYVRNEFNIFSGINFWQLFFAFIFIIAGIFLIFKRRSTFECKKGHFGSSTGIDHIEEIAIFGGGDRTIVTDNFRGGKILAVFGGSNFDLTRSKLAPGKNYIDVLAVFGGLKLVVPEDWNVKISAVSVIGGFSDKRRFRNIEKTADDDKPQLIIKGLLIFGGGEIKS